LALPNEKHAIKIDEAETAKRKKDENNTPALMGLKKAFLGVERIHDDITE
jgi:hypothetical protein